MSSEQLKAEITDFLKPYPAAKRAILVELLQQLNQPDFSDNLVSLAGQIERQLTLLPEQTQKLVQRLLQLQIMVILSPSEAWNQALQDLSQ